MSHSQLVKNVMGVLVVFLVSLLLFEVFLQVSFPDTLFAGKNVNSTMEGPDYTNTIVTNDKGIREIENYTYDHPGVFRFAVIGDSFVFGNSADNDSTIDSVAEKIVNDSAMVCGKENTVEFLNLGKPGVGPTEYYSIMEFAENEYNPDAYIVGIYLGNDFLNSQESHNAPIKQLLKKCKTCVLVYSALVSGQKESSPDQNFSDIPNTVYNKAKNEPDFLMRSLLFSSDEYNTAARDAFESDLIRMRDYAAQKGKKIVFVAMPHALQVSTYYNFFYEDIGFTTVPGFNTDFRVQEAFRDVCLTNNLLCEDISESAMSSTMKDYLYWPRDEHFRPAGYAIVGETIAHDIVHSIISVCSE